MAGPGRQPRADRADRPDPTRERDAALLRGVADGDERALGELYDVHAGALLALATRILGDSSEAEDLVHDLFLEAWQRLTTYDPRRGSVRTWLLVRLRSRAIDRLRSRGVRSALISGRPIEDAVAAVPAAAVPDPSQAADRRHVLAGLGELTNRQREVLELIYFEGLTLREVAERCGVPLGTVKSRMAGAIAALRRRLGDGARVACGTERGGNA